MKTIESPTSPSVKTSNFQNGGNQHLQKKNCLHLSLNKVIIAFYTSWLVDTSKKYFFVLNQIQVNGPQKRPCREPNLSSFPKVFRTT